MRRLGGAALLGALAYTTADAAADTLLYLRAKGWVAPSQFIPLCMLRTHITVTCSGDSPSSHPNRTTSSGLPTPPPPTPPPCPAPPQAGDGASRGAPAAVQRAGWAPAAGWALVQQQCGHQPRWAHCKRDAAAAGGSAILGCHRAGEGRRALLPACVRCRQHPAHAAPAAWVASAGSRSAAAIKYHAPML